MSGTIRENSASLRARLDERRAAPAMDSLPQQLLAAADLVAGDSQLRQTLSDSGQPIAARVALIRALFGPHLSELALEVLTDVVTLRWPAGEALVAAVEDLAAQATFMSAQAAGSLDEFEDQLSGFHLALTGSAQLQMALTDPARSAATKSSLVATILEGRADQQVVALVSHAMGALRGRRADTVVESLMDLAAAQRGRAVAEVRVARALAPDQSERLAEVLSQIHGRGIRLNVAIDPSVIGGISVRIGTQIIDATTVTRIEQARRVLVG